MPTHMPPYDRTTFTMGGDVLTVEHRGPLSAAASSALQRLGDEMERVALEHRVHITLAVFGPSVNVSKALDGLRHLEIGTLGLKPGDTVVLRTLSPVTDADTRRELTRRAAEVFPGHKVILLERMAVDVIQEVA